MPIPDFQTAMLPILQGLADGSPRKHSQLVAVVVDQFKVTPEERTKLLPSGKQTVIDNRVGWARSYMKKAGLLSSPSRGTAIITTEGKSLLATKPERITIGILKKYPSFIAALNAQSGSETDPAESTVKAADDTQTPQERLEKSYLQLRAELAEELLDRVLASSPAFFEQLVVDLLVAMGYGGSAVDAGQSIGKSGDDGIDGVIKEDKLGLDIIYIQAKRWQNSVGRPQIQAFAGSLEGHRARKGVFITTSVFTSEAKEYVTRIEKKIVLIDGTLLAQLMIDHDVGVTPQRTFTLKKMDSDYFDDEV